MFLLALAWAEDPLPAADSGMVPGREVRLVRQVDPTFPHAARKEGEVHTTCEITVRITPEGVPDDLVPLVCDPRFVEPTINAVRRWRFEADDIGGAPAPAMFRVTVAYDWPQKP